MNGYIDIQIRSLQAMGYYLAMKRNAVLMQATSWMDLENLMLRESSQAQRPHTD